MRDLPSLEKFFSGGRMFIGFQFLKNMGVITATSPQYTRKEGSGDRLK